MTLSQFYSAMFAKYPENKKIKFELDENDNELVKELELRYITAQSEGII